MGESEAGKIPRMQPVFNLYHFTLTNATNEGAELAHKYVFILGRARKFQAC